MRCCTLRVQAVVHRLVSSVGVRRGSGSTAQDSTLSASRRAEVMKRKKCDSVVARKTARPASVNPFEVRVNRKKHDILGQKTKSDRGLPGISRSKAVKKVTLVQLSGDCSETCTLSRVSVACIDYVLWSSRPQDNRTVKNNTKL